MSGLYILVVFVIWCLLTVLVLRLADGISDQWASKPVVRYSVWVVVIMTWLSASFWYGGGRKFYYDAWVKEMCAKDGGIRVYETVNLPKNRFDKWGVALIHLKKQAESQDFYYENNMRYFKTGNPEIWRVHFQIVRRLDNKVLGDATSYARRGGDLLGPWHESSFGCPSEADISDLKKRVFATSR